MKRKELAALIAAIKKIRESATDETALESIAVFPAWRADTDYAVDERIRYADKLYRCIQAHTSQAGWTPDLVPALWARVSVEEYPEWIQPYGAEDAYAIGDKVSHNDKRWISIADGNVWEPGVFGWDEVIE